MSDLTTPPPGEPGDGGYGRDAIDTIDAGGPAGARRRVPRWVTVVAGAAAVLLVALGVAGVLVQRKIDPPGGPGEEVTVEIPLGSSTVRIGEILEAAGVIESATVWRWYVRFTGGGSFQAGRYTFATNLAMGDAVDVLEQGPEIRYDRITVPPGFTVDQIAARFGQIPRFESSVARRLLTSGEIRSAYSAPGVDTLEGLLFPDTYFIDEREDERAVIQRMVSSFERVAKEVGLDRAEEKTGLSPYEVVIVASLIEREARVADDRGKISRVIYNRLAEGMRLQIDATVLYALGEHKDRVLFSDLEVDSPYNTYRVDGLPPTPIAVPGRAALEAALAPTPGPWRFYVVIDENGGHAFAATAEEHAANIAEARRRGVR